MKRRAHRSLRSVLTEVTAKNPKTQKKRGEEAWAGKAPHGCSQVVRIMSGNPLHKFFSEMFLRLPRWCYSGCMKRIVRNKATRAYLSSEGEWVSDFRLAANFTSVEAAFSAVRSFAAKDVEYVLVIGQQPSDYDVAVSFFPSPWK